MKRDGLLKSLIWMVALAVLATSVGAMGAERAKKKRKTAKPKQPPVKITGTISVVEKDGKIRSVKLTTDKGEVLAVSRYGKGKELGEKMNGRKVEVVATRTESKGKKYLRVRTYRALEGAAEDEEGEGEGEGGE